MSYLMTWASPSIIVVLYSLGPSIHMPTACMGREQSCIGIIIGSINKSRISIPFISPTCLLERHLPQMPGLPDPRMC